MACSRRLLCQVKGSTLEKMFWGDAKVKKLEGEIFVDRDGETFERMINYLRNERKIWPDLKNIAE